MIFIPRLVYTYDEFVFIAEATAVQQNDSDRTKNTDNKIKRFKKKIYLSHTQLYRV